MHRWAIVTVVLYVAILAALYVPVVTFAFLRISDGELVVNWAEFPYASGVFWAWLGLMALAQTALLAIPVRVARGRPVPRRWIVWPLLVAFVMFLALAAGMFLVAWETLGHLLDGEPSDNQWPIVIAFSVIGAMWLLWVFLFGFYCGNREPKTVMSRVVRFLVAGSILELLVAVPAHIFARVKDQCCGGFYTVWGLAAGIAVMLLSFGPGAFVLFARRYASLRKPKGETQPE